MDTPTQRHYPRVRLIALLRTVLVLALTLPALLLPRGVTLTACLCGQSVDSAVCTVTCNDNPAATCCCAGTCRAEHEAAGEPDEGPRVERESRCPGCHLLTVDYVDVDFIGDGLPATLALPSSSAFVVIAEEPARCATDVVAEVGRAPPGAVVDAGRLPGVLPLRI